MWRPEAGQRGHIQVHRDHVARLPAAMKDVVARGNHGPFGIIVYQDAGVGAPGRHAEGQPAPGLRCREHAQVDRAGPGVVGGDLQVEPAPESRDPVYCWMYSVSPDSVAR